MPRVEGLNDVRSLTSTSALSLDRLPSRLLIMGGGYIGLETRTGVSADSAAALASSSGGPHLLPTEDSDVSLAIETIFRDDGIELLLNAEVTAAEGRSGEHVRLRVQTPGSNIVLEGTDLLVAVGRVPMTAGTGLESAGVELNAQGFIRVNERLETSASDTWALGDCRGQPAADARRA